MANLKRIIYLTQAQKAELFTNNTVTVNGVTINYDPNDIYVTPDDGTINGHTILSDVPANAIFTDTTYSAGDGLSLTGTTFKNSGVREINTGIANGTILVNTNGTSNSVTVKGLDSAAYTSSTDYATAEQGALANGAMQKTGGTFTGAVTLAGDPSLNLQAATKQYVDNNVAFSQSLASGQEIGEITINGTTTKLYAPYPSTPTIAVTQAANAPTLEFVVGTHTSSVAALTGVLSDTTAIAEGKIVYFLTPYAIPAGNKTLTLTYADSGNSSTAIPIYTADNQQDVSPYPAYSVLVMVYYDSKFYIVGNAITSVANGVLYI